MKYRKKPVVVEAYQWDGTADGASPILRWIGLGRTEYRGDSLIGRRIYIDTPEGRMEASPDDWIIKGVFGEFYPCKPDIFDATYEPVE